jgi:hypothetical protein
MPASRDDFADQTGSEIHPRRVFAHRFSRARFSSRFIPEARNNSREIKRFSS